MQDWRDVKVLVGGGGSQMPYVKGHFRGPVYEGLPRWELEPAQAPGDLDLGDTMQSSEFHRIAVAYGLSTPWPQQPEERFVKHLPEASPPHAQAFTFHWDDSPG